jgi:hypothetical protein
LVPGRSSQLDIEQRRQSPAKKVVVVEELAAVRARGRAEEVEELGDGEGVAQKEERSMG